MELEVEAGLISLGRIEAAFTYPIQADPQLATEGQQHTATAQPNSMNDKPIDDLNSQQLYHGTKVDLKKGDLIGPGYNSNYGTRKQAKHVYLTGTLNAATWGAELAVGEGPGRIYIVEPTGPFEDDPNLTDKKFPGNPTKSYRTRDPLRIVGEVTDWQPHSPEQLQAMKDCVERARRLGIEA